MKKHLSLLTFCKTTANIIIFLLFISALAGALFFPLNISPISVVLFLLSISLIIYIFKSSILSTYKKIIATKRFQVIIISFLFFIQIIVFSSISGTILFDAGSIYTGVFATDKTDVITYLSTWQNNFPLYVYENIIKNIFHLTSITKMTNVLYTIVNIVNYDLGFLFLALLMKKLYGHSTGINTLLTCFLVLGLNNQMYQFYTTALSWPATCLGLYLYIRLKDQFSKRLYLILALVLGFLLSWGYLVRPSSIIYIFAIIIFELLNLKPNKKTLFKNFIICSVILCGFFGFNMLFRFVSIPYTLPLDENKHAVMTQYLAYGITGDGAGTSEVRSAIANAPNQQARQDTALSIWKSELKSNGPITYFKFLLRKHLLETRDGTYGLTNPHIEEIYSQNPFIHFLQHIWYSDGKYVSITAIIMQGIYVLFLLGVVLSIRINDNFSFILKLSLIGWHMFLLIFEGARTGYTIQAFPVMIPLSVLGYMSFYKKYDSSLLK